MPEADEISINHFKPLEKIDALGAALFWLTAILSLIQIVKITWITPTHADWLESAFLMCSILFFIQGVVQKLYFFPRAEDARRKGFFSDAFGVPLTHELTEGYYNSLVGPGLKRMLTNVMENAFFTKSILAEMLHFNRAVTIIYILVYLVLYLGHLGDLSLMVVAGQVLFSEEILSRWLRLEWVRGRSEQVFTACNTALMDGSDLKTSSEIARALDIMAYYETTKAAGGILLSSKVFNRINETKTAEWNRLRGSLSI